MFRIIKSHKTPVVGMATAKSEVLQHLKDLSREVHEHILKCMIYENSTQDWNHWIHGEIVSYLNTANRFHTKPRNKKLSKKEYLNTLFVPVGDTEEDTELSLEMFYYKQVKTHKYPDFKITQGLISGTHYALTHISDKFSTEFSTDNDLTRTDIESELKKILETAVEQKHRKDNM